MTDSHQKSLFADEVPWEAADQSDRWSAEIVFDLPVDQSFHYLVPDALREQLQAGQRVRVPFGQGNRRIVGFCVATGPPPSLSKRMKWVEAIVDLAPLVTPGMLQLTRWIGEHYLCSWGTVLHAVVPAGVKKNAGTRMARVYFLGDSDRLAADVASLTKKQEAVLDVIKNAKQPPTQGQILEAVGCGPSPVKTLERRKLIASKLVRTSTSRYDSPVAAQVTDLELNQDQKDAVTAICQVLESRKHETILLHGVTGSGKTEVYIQAIREVISYGRQAIVLVPEISLTPQTIRRFRSRFDTVAVLHSHLSDAERHWHWQQIAAGRVSVVVGARSAVFAPTPHLGLIVIDEEHETSFKQETTPRYHAREVARQRCELEQVPLVLGSATPTLESWQRVQDGEDQLVSMPRRVVGLPLPPVVLVDIRNDPRIGKGAAIGRALDHAIRQAIEDDGQVILFLNLRGFSPVFWCRACGESVTCPNCDVTLTWHRDKAAAMCHSCEYTCDPPSQCPACGDAGIRHVGVGTQRLEAEVKARYPEWNCLRMDSDSMRGRGSHDEALEKFRSGEVQILLGTQMIAKGLDFPNVTLVGVIAADTMLHQPDMRASERTFQLIAQVAGRTGRSERGGRVLVQTAMPAEPSIQFAAKHDYIGFTTQELSQRRAIRVPPYRRLARVIVRGPVEPDVVAQITAMAAVLRDHSQRLGIDNDVMILGPAPAPLTRLKTFYRYHLQISAETPEAIRTLWRNALPDFLDAKDIEFTIDVDPLNMR
ncbi:replication restart helicase PriA [Thalassoroseus pseudoceratinae]|uniref:replication restart helicase PriA n=1 Tax=Thalassoroseus pseudoceratinae TaxID=2713176 RepID=UPI001420EBC1|nr:primosomal protein N' [Thalassoroseus pseudoceratinae]